MYFSSSQHLTISPHELITIRKIMSRHDFIMQLWQLQLLPQCCLARIHHLRQILGLSSSIDWIRPQHRWRRQLSLLSSSMKSHERSTLMVTGQIPPHMTWTYRPLKIPEGQVELVKVPLDIPKEDQNREENPSEFQDGTHYRTTKIKTNLPHIASNRIGC